jgi:hypothetical protein
MENRHRRGRSTFSIAGWLFADLLLALMMIFLVASTVGVYIPPAPIHPPPTPTPPVPPRLELKFHRFSINIDPSSLLNGTPSEIDNIKSQVRAQTFLKGRSVGIVIVYGGAPGDSSIPTALNIASNVYEVLATLGREGFAFTRASHYDPLYVFGDNLSLVTIDVYLFAK